MKETIQMAHGNGGILMHRLIKELLLPHFGYEKAEDLNDSAILAMQKKSIAFTTDTYVVNPLFFPGGDIGTLAINGTVNDLSVVGAEPLYLSCGMVIEEGLETAVLEKIVSSMEQESKKAGVKVVTGDTKVVERGAAHRLFINTAGIGILKDNIPTGNIEPGDKVIINGPIGDHGIAVMIARNEFDIETRLESDCAALNRLIGAVLDEGLAIKFMRDPTRGGLATVLNELTEDKSIGIELHEDSIPVKPEVREICDLLGFDPLYIANEGKVVMITSGQDAPAVLDRLRRHPQGVDAAIIGEVTSKNPGKVVMETHVSGRRIIDMLVTDQFPRIC